MHEAEESEFDGVKLTNSSLILPMSSFCFDRVWQWADEYIFCQTFEHLSP